ncbi:hypothetical protein SNE40_017357 [Patella caerulea]|uniref:Uncharacterized protein n=1 Tax=Patella caerulea TaxID=87958 RepID=A0AAN8PDY2_PATCE
MLLHKSMCIEHNDFVQELLTKFVEHFSAIYGPDLVVYNIHNLIHLPDDARNYGSLNNISAFPFENYLGSLVELVRKPSNVLEQIVRRLHEEINYAQNCNPTSSSPHLRKEYKNGFIPLNMQAQKHFREVKLNGFMLSIHQPNNCANIRGDIGLIRIIVCSGDEIVLIYQKFNQQCHFFEYPISSSKIGIYVVSELCANFSTKNIKSINNKCVMLPFKKKFVIIPLNHD